MTYLVLDIRSGETIKRTENSATAAQCLTPGTTFGRGETVDEAKAQASERREFHLQFKPYKR